MSTKARKARKRAGVKFEKAAKVGTPLEERSVPMVTKQVKGVLGVYPSNRAAKKLTDRAEFLASFDPKPAPRKRRLLSRKGGK